MSRQISEFSENSEIPFARYDCGHAKITFKEAEVTKSINIRDLESHAEEVIRDVETTNANYIITVRGKPAALIVPIDEETRKKYADEAWARLEEIGKELAKGWQNKKSAVEILSEMRR